MGLRLGFHYHVPALLKEDEIYTPGYQAVFIDSLAPYCEKIICFLHSPHAEEAYQCSSKIQSKNVELVNIGLHGSVPQRMLYSRSHTAPLFERKDELDALLIRGPSPLLPAMARRVPELPKALLLVASYMDGVDSLPQPRWRKELIRLWSFWNESQQLKIAKQSLTFVNSARLYNNLHGSVPKLIQTRTTTISEKDIVVREDTCQRPPYHILFSGRITSEKGIYDILEALSLLSKQKVDFILDLVGMPENIEFMPELWSHAEKSGIRDRIRYHGFKSVGEELFSYYRQADVFIIASQSSEGFPRTIWEAFSQSTPVIATSVGSIPIFLKNGQDALLATPNCPAELAESLMRIFSDSDLRKRLIHNGRQLAQENTLDARAKEMIKKIISWLERT
ncbi:glycosyltransferase [Levilinea saccharolytica]|uniref:glycosyltransferase n=1 Tax=Levilinea saccharolytica TaxID=229921 RepID=UPI0009E61AEA|nr:glycosyltransferase [Levilinea saccharolytica]GAP18817.1 glycosyltransferase [Levilinea saccharolytica]